jgi:hypothetical protein
MNREELIKYLNLSGLGIEVGVQSGDYAAKILEYSNLHLITLDAWRYLEEYPDKANVNTDYHLMLMNNAIKRLMPFEGRYTLMRELSEVACKFFPDYTFDFVYIDANHEKNAVYKDLVNWYPKVKSGGIFAGHDYINIKDEINDFGVKDAVDEFFAEKGISIKIEDIQFPTWYIVKP